MASSIIFSLDPFLRIRKSIFGKPSTSGNIIQLPSTGTRSIALRTIKNNTEAIFKLVKEISRRSVQHMIIMEETNLLNKPGINASVCKTLEKGSCVTIRGSINNYYYVSENGIEGWILKVSYNSKVHPY